MIKTLYWALKGRLILIIFFSLIGFLSRGLLIGSSNVLGGWVDFLTSGHPFVAFSYSLQSSDQFILFLLSASGIGFLSTWIYRIGFSDLNALMISSIYDEMTYRTSRYPSSFFDQNSSGRIITRFSSDYGNVFRLFGGPLAEFLSIIFDLTWMLVFLTTANPRFLPFLVASIVLHSLIYKHFKSSLRKNRQTLSQARSPGISHFVESLNGATSIRIFNKEPSFITRFERLDRDYILQKIKTVGRMTQFIASLNFLAFLLYLSMALFGWWGLNHNILTIGDLGIAFGLVALSGNTVQMFFEWLAQFEEAIVGLERLNEYLYLPIEPGTVLPSLCKFPTPHQHDSDLTPRPDRDSEKRDLVGSLRVEKRPTTTEHDLQIKDLWFRYHNQGPWILKGINLTIPSSNAKVGIIGRTGAGKSTLIQCLFQLYPIEKGNIYIHNFVLPLSGPQPHVNTEKINSNQSYIYQNHTLEQARRLFSYIPQDPQFFRGSLLENIDPLNQAGPERVSQILNLIQRPEWAQQLDRPIAEKGKNYSAGERQLLQLARVLVQDRPFIVMDEATSNIDPTTENLIVKILNQELKDRTQIIVAHRLSTLLSCTHVIWLDQGQVKMIGTPDQVLPQFRSQL